VRAGRYLGSGYYGYEQTDESPESNASAMATVPDWTPEPCQLVSADGPSLAQSFLRHQEYLGHPPAT
jgi:hypothetical protein